jgi:hypothetical protein
MHSLDSRHNYSEYSNMTTNHRDKLLQYISDNIGCSTKEVMKHMEPLEHQQTFDLLTELKKEGKIINAYTTGSWGIVK